MEGRRKKGIEAQQKKERYWSTTEERKVLKHNMWY